MRLQPLDLDVALPEIICTLGADLCEDSLLTQKVFPERAGGAFVGGEGHREGMNSCGREGQGAVGICESCSMSLLG